MEVFRSYFETRKVNIFNTLKMIRYWNLCVTLREWLRKKRKCHQCLVTQSLHQQNVFVFYVPDVSLLVDLLLRKCFSKAKIFYMRKTTC